jgi:hypothetical protein
VPVIKEFSCNQCGLSFERIRGVCPSCHSEDTRRVFLTPVGIATGVAKRTDAILQHQFDKMGITNFSNSGGGANKVSWKPLKTGTHDSGGQEPINPLSGAGAFGSLFPAGAVTRTIDTPDGVQTVPYAVPRDVGAHIAAGTPIGGRPTALLKSTNIVGKIDSDGRSVQRVG